MRYSTLFYVLAGASSVLSSALQPYVAHEAKYIGAAEKRHIDIYDESIAYIEGRSLHLGKFDLAQTFPASKVLVSVYVL